MTLQIERTAVLVDAGYFYAEGAKAIHDQTLERRKLRLERVHLLRKLKGVACRVNARASLLRIYWYDGMPPQGLSNVHLDLANSDDVKLRLGVVTKAKRQKGVDSLIVTDIVELARNGAISDAVLMSGDEDVRIGVQLAQSFGVRVHLLGIETGGANQSPWLVQEADTAFKWSKEDIAEVLSVVSEDPPDFLTITKADPGASPVAVRDALDELVGNAIDSWTDWLQTNAGPLKDGLLPRRLDTRLLAAGRETLSRDLTKSERVYLRNAFTTQTRIQLADGTNPPNNP